LDRLLTVDASRARADAIAQLAQTHQVLVIVNSSKYGGSGGLVAVCSTDAAAAKIAIHEIGHSAYGLADEYEGAGTATGPEPMEPNVTRDSNRATNKWRDLVAATTPMPSSCNSGCTGCTPPASPPPVGAVGAYEGARYFTCGMFRPLPSCYMRDYNPFCPVCARVIRQTHAPFLPAPDFGIAPEDSIPYNPANLRIANEGASGWLLTDDVSRMLILDNETDAKNALALAQRHTGQCFIGRDNPRPNRRDYIVQYWKGHSGLSTTMSEEDCIPYNPANVRIVNEGATGWLLTDDVSRMLILDNETDAKNALALARHHTAQCFIGRGNPRPNRKDYIVEYWRC
jgi:hypothetical protein